MPLIKIDLQTQTKRTEFDIDDAELTAIGRVTVQWAYLEHGVFAVTLQMSHGAEMDLPKDALHASFKRRLRALHLLVEEQTTGEDRTRLLRLLGQIANAEQDRHKITHGMWEWDKENPERIAASSFRPGYEFEKTFDAERINKLADNIGQINFALEYPGGMTEVWDSWKNADGQIAYGSTTRQQSRETKAQIDR
ncbi:MAG TPA: hypothetical protein VGB39_01785, partial [Sphingomicrobium sp.]